jgi:TRAP-type transport system periplasmic protein
MKPRRSTFVVGTASGFATLGFLRFAAGAAEFSYKIGSVVPSTHPIAVRAYAAADKIKQESGGRLEIGVFPNNALGGDSALILQTRTGALEFLISNDAVLMSIVPALGLTGVPFVFSRPQNVWTAMDGILGRYIRDTIVKANVNLYPFARVWESGFRQIANYVRPIHTPADLKGLKIRVQNSPAFVETFRALGAIPTPIDGNQIYVALQTHLVDGSDVTLTATESGKYYEVLKYISLTNHQWQGYTMLANTEAWARLPKPLRDIVERNFNDAALLDRYDIVRLEQTLRSTLEGHGLIFNEADARSFKTTLQAARLYSKWRDEYGATAWSLLEKVAGKLT